MPRFEGATYFDLKGGLNTESSPLNIPPTDAVSIENVDINRDGSIERRRAMDFLGAASSGDLYLDSPILDYTALFGATFRAETPSFTQFSPVNNVGELQRLVVMHLGNSFYIYNYASPEQLKEIDDPVQIVAPGFTDQQALYRTSFLSDQQKLLVINPLIPFGHLLFDNTASLATAASYVRTDPQHRDDSDGVTSVIEDIADADLGWSAGAVSGSRVWLGGTSSNVNTVYYSQTIVNGDEHAKMYQAADPFDATDNQLVDTDGGSIKLIGAEKILAIAEMNGGVIVFANNGVWSISGQDGFRPTSYSINKISDIGIIGREAWAEVEHQLVFCSTGNIYTILAGNSIDTPEVAAVGDKITTFYTSVPLYNRTALKVVYNTDLKKLYFFMNFGSESWTKDFNPFHQATQSRNVLVLDVRLAAWSKYSLSEDTTGDSVAIGDAATLDGGRLSLGNIVTNSGTDRVVDSLGNPVTANDPLVTDAELVTNTLFMKRSGDSWKVAFGELVTTGLTDFASSTDSDEEDNASHITLAHQLFKDAAHRKFVPYMIPLFERMETGTLDASGVDVTPGGCKYRVDWNWAVNAFSTEFGTLRDAYFPNKYTTSRFDGVDAGTGVVSSKLKIRGSGEVMRLHFESDGSKDFKLLGWQLMIHAKGRV